MTPEQARMVERNLRLVSFTVNKYYPNKLPIGDYDDVISIGTIGLCKAVETYDPTRKNTFSTYAVKCIRNEIRMELRKTRAEKRGPDNEPLSLDKLYGDEFAALLDFVPDPDADLDRIMEAKEKLQRVQKAFGDEPILLSVATGQMTQREAAFLLGTAQVSIHRRIKRGIQTILREEQEENGENRHESGGNNPRRADRGAGQRRPERKQFLRGSDLQNWKGYRHYIRSINAGRADAETNGAD